MVAVKRKKKKQENETEQPHTDEPADAEHKRELVIKGMTGKKAPQEEKGGDGWARVDIKKKKYKIKQSTQQQDHRKTPKKKKHTNSYSEQRTTKEARDTRKKQKTTMNSKHKNK